MNAAGRAAIFWAVCIPTRLSLTATARTLDPVWLRVLALGIGVTWLSGREMGNEGVFGGPAFWADERPQHGALWTAYAATGAWQFLLADTLYGAANWVRG